MEREDARKLSPAEQLERRRQVIRAWKRGRNRRQIAAEIGLSYSAVRATVNSYKKNGVQGLESGRRGRPTQSSRKLTDEQHMSELDGAPDRVAAFFRDPKVAYAA